MENHNKIAVKILSGGRAGVIHEFERSTDVLIGRDADAHIRLHPTEDRMVGRRHARLFFLNDGWYIESLHDQGVLVHGELTAYTLRNTRQAVRGFLTALGSKPLDQIAEAELQAHRTWLSRGHYRPHTIHNHQAGVRAMLRYAYNMRFLSELPRLAFAYDPPIRSVLRKDRATQIKKHGPLLFTADEVRRMIEASTRPAYLRSCILLGINGGFGQQDCGMLEDEHVDLDSRVIVFPRPKTGVERVVPLWPETIASMTAWRIVCPTAAAR